MKQLDLADELPLASGNYRNVYQHPHHENLLVKVLKPETFERYRLRAKSFSRLRRRHVYKALLREFEEYLRLRQLNRHRLPFLQRCLGLVDTDIGFGTVVEKICDRNGAFAPTLATVVRHQGFTEALGKKINRLLDEVSECHVVFSGVTPNNIVSADDDVHGDRLVIIDGLGERLFFPLNNFSHAYNRRSCAIGFRALRKKLAAIDGQRIGID